MRPILVLSSLLLFLLASTGGHAQGFSGGFRAGLNFITKSGPVEMSPDGSVNYERANRTTGFHVGATFAYAFTDLVGVKADLLYSQRGSEIVFTDTPSYFYLYDGPEDTEGTLLLGTRNSETDVVNSYIDLPITAYYRIGGLEIEGGVSVGLLVGSRASGGIVYTNVPRFPGATFNFNQNANYLSDEAGFAGIESFSETMVGNIFPPESIGAYYLSTSDDNLYRRLEFGLVGGLAYYLNNGLYIGGRYQFGLTDTTQGENDLRVSRAPDVDGRSFNEGDEDFTRTIQVSVGFRF